MTELYLYQTIHLNRGRARLLGAHIALLDEASRELFGIPYTPDPARLEARIAFAARGYPPGLSGFVRLELLPDGTERLLPIGASLYDGYALRSVMPEAIILTYFIPFTEAPTSAREAVEQLARKQTELSGGTVALRTDYNDYCLSADDAPLFAVKAGEVFTTPAFSGMRQEERGTEGPWNRGYVFPSVERDLALHAIRNAKFTLREEPFSCSDLRCFDEVFYVDHRGVTSIGHCEQIAFMSLAAERIAAQMEQLFRKV